MHNLLLAIGLPFGWANLILTYRMLFPAGFSFGELSYAEIIFLLLLYIATTRHWKRGAAVGHSLARRIVAPLAVLGIQTALVLVISRIDPSLKMTFFGKTSVVGSLCWYALIIFALLVSAPARPPLTKTATLP